MKQIRYKLLVTTAALAAGVTFAAAQNVPGGGNGQGQGARQEHQPSQSAQERGNREQGQSKQG